MSRKEKLADIEAQDDYLVMRWRHADDDDKWPIAYLAGYAACEQDAKELVEKFEQLVRECLIEAGFREQEPHPTVKECVEILAKWKERGE